MPGGSKVSVPGPSAAETALVNEQVEILRQQRDILYEQNRVNQLLAPFLFESAGVKPIFSTPGTNAPADNAGTTDQGMGTGAPRSTTVGAQGAIYKAEGGNSYRNMDTGAIETFDTPPGTPNAEGVIYVQPGTTLNSQVGGPPPATGSSGTKSGTPQSNTPQIIGFEQLPKTTAETLAERLAQAQLDQLGPQSEIQKLQLDQLKQQLQAANERGPQEAELSKLLIERSLAAARGELPVDSAIIRDLDEGETLLRDRLRTQLGSGFETSTPGIEALANYTKRRQEVIDGARRAELTLSEQLGLGREASQYARFGNAITDPAAGAFGSADLGARLRTGKLSDIGNINNFAFSGGSNLSQLVQGYQSPLQNYQANRQMQLQAQVANSQRVSPFATIAGQGLGIAGGMYAAKKF